jgi:hypothetical protein
MRKYRFIRLLPALLLLTVVSLATQPDYIYVAATNVRIRDQAATSGKIVETLPIGTWGKVLAVSKTSETLLGKTAPWYKINANENEGWIFGGLTLATNANERFSNALKIISLQLADEKKSAADLIQTLEFAARTAEMASHSLEKARLESAIFQLLDRIYTHLATGGEDKSQHPDAIAKYYKFCYYHESAGQCFVKPDTYWELAEKYADILEAGEEIAWRAARQQMPGESEGDPDMMIFFYENGLGRYIESYPEGKNVATALDSARAVLDQVTENLSYYQSSEDKSQLKEKLDWFTDLANITPASEARSRILASIKKLRDRLSN